MPSLGVTLDCLLLHPSNVTPYVGTICQNIYIESVNCFISETLPNESVFFIILMCHLELTPECYEMISRKIIFFVGSMFIFFSKTGLLLKVVAAN
jgi:hypothetical protein